MIVFFSFPRSADLEHNLGTVCLSRSDKPLFDNGKKTTTTKSRKNLRSLMKNVTADHLICYGKDESYKWEDVCKYDEAYAHDSRRPCQLKNGDILQLNPV